MNTFIGAMLVIAGNLIDYLTTRTALSRGARDMNRLIRPKTLLTVKGVGTLVQLVIAIVFVPEHLRLYIGASIFALFVAIGFWNHAQTPNG